MRPRVTLKAAITLDGKIATRTGSSQWITGSEARVQGHQLRHQHDAILVGVQTVLHDNPQLTTRNIEQAQHPIRIILDSHFKTPLDSLCLNNDGVLCLVVVGSAASVPWDKLQANIKVLQAPTKQPEIPWLLEQLSEFQIRHILVEGGATVHASFIKSQLVDELILFMAPKLVGGNAPSWCGELDILQICNAIPLNIQDIQPCGNDIMICACFNTAEKETAL